MKKKFLITIFVIFMICSITAFAGCNASLPADSSDSNSEEITDGNTGDNDDSEEITDGNTGDRDDSETIASATMTERSIATAEIPTFKYWLYAPANACANMPLVVYLHGGSGKGNDLNQITSVDGFPKYLKDGTLGNIEAYVIIPQLPKNLTGWINAERPLITLINSTVSEFEIDKTNVSLVGHSMGGTGTWNMAAAHPELFARVAPMSGSMKITPECISALKTIPVWAFVGSADAVVPPTSSRQLVNAIVSAGGSAFLTEFDGVDHASVPAAAFLDEKIGIIDWLIGKK